MDGCCGQTPAGDLLGYPESEFRASVSYLDQVDTTKHLAAVPDQDVKVVCAGCLPGEQAGMLLVVVREEIVTTVRDPGGEISPVVLLEAQQGSRVIKAN